MKRLFSALSKIKIQRTFGAVAMDASSFALRISWLKFEPKVSNFRHETAKLFAAVPCYYNWEVYFEIYQRLSILFTA